jgi:hypothetical protein
MLLNYMRNLRLSLPSAVLYLNQIECSVGNSIKGHLEIKGGFFKNVLKRYEIDLVREERDNLKEELLNSSSVYCSRECLPKKKEIIPFIINIPENVSEQSDKYIYSIVVRTVWEDSQIVLKKHHLVIQDM